MGVSIIISFRQSDEDRAVNLKGLLSYLGQLVTSDVELIVVEQDSESRLGWMTGGKVKHVFIKNDGVFNKGMGYNVGAKASSGEYLLFTDVDLYMSIEQYLGSLAYMPDHDVVKPYTRLHYLDKVNSCRFLADYDMGIIGERGMVLQSIKPTVISGGIFAIKRELFFALKGFDERCRGYGYEDDIFDMKMRKTFLNIKFLTADCIHVYHPSMRGGMDTKDKYYSLFKQNGELAHLYNKMLPSEIARTIRDTHTWGEVDYEVIAH
jgi:predicted glycosyltransferase involved in capsule biosynthesis